LMSVDMHRNVTTEATFRQIPFMGSGDWTSMRELVTAGRPWLRGLRMIGEPIQTIASLAALRAGYDEFS